MLIGLYINVITPTPTIAAIPSNGLPVVVWIYGGGFATGDASKNDGTDIVARSISIGTPIVYVSFVSIYINVTGFQCSRIFELTWPSRPCTRICANRITDRTALAFLEAHKCSRKV